MECWRIDIALARAQTGIAVRAGAVLEHTVDAAKGETDTELEIAAETWFLFRSKSAIRDREGFTTLASLPAEGRPQRPVGRGAPHARRCGLSHFLCVSDPSLFDRIGSSPGHSGYGFKFKFVTNLFFMEAGKG